MVSNFGYDRSLLKNAKIDPKYYLKPVLPKLNKRLSNFVKTLSLRKGFNLSGCFYNYSTYITKRYIQ